MAWPYDFNPILESPRLYHADVLLGLVESGNKDSQGWEEDEGEDK